MNLNANVDEGLNDNLVIDIKQNSINNITIKVNSKNTLVPTLESFITKSLALKDMCEIKANLISRKTICKTDAISIEEFFGEFIGKVTSLEEFTDRPTKVNYDLALNFITKGIAKEEITLVETSANGLKEELETLQLHKNNITDARINDIIEDVSSMLANYYSLINALIIQSNVIFVSSREGQISFVNLANSTINSIAENKVVYSDDKEKPLDWVKLHTLFSMLAEETDVASFINFVYMVKNGVSVKDFYSNYEHETKARIDYEGFSLIDLVKLFKNSGMITEVTNLKSTFYIKYEQLENFIKTNKESNLEVFNNLKDSVSPSIKIVEVIENLSRVVDISKKLFEELNKVIV